MPEADVISIPPAPQAHHLRELLDYCAAPLTELQQAARFFVTLRTMLADTPEHAELLASTVAKAAEAARLAADRLTKTAINARCFGEDMQANQAEGV